MVSTIILHVPSAENADVSAAYIVDCIIGTNESCLSLLMIETTHHSTTTGMRDSISTNR